MRIQLNNINITLSAVFLLTISSIGIALISQHVFSILPCAWCVLQRLIYLSIAIVVLMCLLLPQRQLKLLVSLTFVLPLCIAGIVAAWYQYDVAQNLVSCNQTLADRIMHSATGLDQSMPWLFGIYGDCASSKASIFGLDYALVSLCMYALLALITLYGIRTKK